jgi:DNA-binding response OmpR family regulator
MPKILVIDDDVYTRQALQFRLEKERFQVVMASEGREAVTMAERERPDLIVLDLVMPDIDGVQVLEQLRENVVTWEIPVVVFTARGDAESRADTQRLGALRFLQKPFSLRRLVSEIRRLLGNADAEADSPA